FGPRFARECRVAPGERFSSIVEAITRGKALSAAPHTPARVRAAPAWRRPPGPRPNPSLPPIAGQEKWSLRKNAYPLGDQNRRGFRAYARGRRRTRAAP